MLKKWVKCTLQYEKERRRFHYSTWVSRVVCIESCHLPYILATKSFTCKFRLISLAIYVKKKKNKIILPVSPPFPPSPKPIKPQITQHPRFTDGEQFYSWTKYHHFNSNQIPVIWNSEFKVMYSTQTFYGHLTAHVKCLESPYKPLASQTPTSSFGWVRFVTQVWLYLEKLPATAVTKANYAALSASEMNSLFIKLCFFITNHMQVFNPSHSEQRFASYAVLKPSTVASSGSYCTITQIKWGGKTE